MGRYQFDKQTAAAEDDYLHSPMSLRFKGQYYFRPQWTLDASANYIRWSKFHVAGADNSESSNQWMFGTGVTYHFGNSEISNHEPSQEKADQAPVVQSAVTPMEQQREEVAKVLDTEKTDTGFKAYILSAAFNTSQTKLNPEFKKKILDVGTTLAKNPNQKIRVHCFTDSSGGPKRNLALSKARAEEVKAALIEAGVDSSRISVEGLGSKNPIASNQTTEGRASNRRVELFVDGE